MKDKTFRALRPDAQAFDSIVLETIPRYKESELSGDEWRISVSASFIRKGKVIETKLFGNMEYAVAMLGGAYHDLVDSGKGYFGGIDQFCDQEGCSNIATVTLKKKFDYCNQGHKTELASDGFRMFCEKHSSRGDCGLDDSDENYVSTHSN